MAYKGIVLKIRNVINWNLFGTKISSVWLEIHRYLSFFSSMKIAEWFCEDKYFHEYRVNTRKQTLLTLLTQTKPEWNFAAESSVLQEQQIKAKKGPFL